VSGLLPIVHGSAAKSTVLERPGGAADGLGRGNHRVRPQHQVPRPLHERHRGAGPGAGDREIDGVSDVQSVVRHAEGGGRHDCGQGNGG
jgi:hypothetical protein